MEVKFRLLDIDYVIEGEPVIRLFGTSNGKKITARITNFPPYFYAVIDEKRKDEIKEKIINIKTQNHYVTGITEEKGLLDYGKKVSCLKIMINEPAGVYSISREAGEIQGVLAKRENDIKYVKRFLIDKGLRPTDKLSVTGNEVKVLHDSEWKPKALAFDIETYSSNARTSNPKKDPVIMISLYGAGHKEVLLTKPCRDDRTRVFKNEESMLKEFSRIIKEEQPDIIISYNGDNFDLPYLRERMNKYRIRMDWGVDGSNIKIIKRQAKTVSRIKGIMNIDLFQFVLRILSNKLKTNTLDLNSVAFELIGERKVENDWEQFFKQWDAGKTEELIDYSFNDARITYKLFKKLNPLIIELSRMSQQTLYDTARSSRSQLVENYLMSKAKEAKQLILNKPGRDKVFERRRMQKFKGGFVYEPKPGIYKKIAVLDFRSLYPSIIVVFNICPTTINCNCCKSKFCQKKQGFIPKVVNEILKKRTEIKKQLKSNKDPILLARSNALKDILSAAYGYLGFPNARWYCYECAERITGIGRNTIKETIRKAEKKGFNVAYADTDSVFLTNTNKKRVKEFLKKVNKDLPDKMELELEGFFERGLFVSLKDGERGAKKKYALIDKEGNLMIKGFASIRGDWAGIAKKTQIKVFNALLKDKSKEKAARIIKKIINELKKGQTDINELIIRVQLKRPIEEYKVIGPHVAVAKRLLEKGYQAEPGMIIEYIVVKGKGRIRDKARPVFEVKDEELEYDAEYYINHQVIPAIGRIMELLGVEKEQKKLNEYFK